MRHPGAARPLLAVAAGVLSGALGAFAASTPVIRPLAHTIGLWALLVALLCAGTTRAVAMTRSTLALVGAVIAFFGLTGFHLSAGKLALWLALAVISGLALGEVSRRIPHPLATATTAGLLVADAARRGWHYPNQIPFLAAFLLIALAALAWRARPLHPRTALFLPLTTALGYAVVAAPDLLEDLIR
ncbi:hypothetical protein JOD54_006273 [Actinokineospora baliensis]|uniref:hypothetical protein n=1 Tax=Actinokineospora baliensis TaxID=547056 RepID=UPI00195CE188|nr:hypothetical protein [Actinokineospora baliensis]MBM7776069.1 hypothetical protein [Actinokineospora baliensis]